MSTWSYDQCAACPRTHRVVLPDGPHNAEYMLIGEGPGKHEDACGIPFVGQSGQELDKTYLPLAGLNRGNDVFVTNMVQCRCERNGVDVKPGELLARTCAQNHLLEEIHTVSPKVLVLCGASACSLVPGLSLELEHGIPRNAEVPLLEWEGTVVPMYHPAAGMHESRFMIPLLEDWKRLGAWRWGKWRAPAKPDQVSIYTLLRRPEDVILSLIHDGPYEHLPIDTESDEGRPWSIQYSPRLGSAYMILAADKSLVEIFREQFYDNWEGRAVMHHAVHDLDDLDKLGIQPRAVRDTMQELYHLGNLPQGLKAAVYRVFGFRMHSYAETVIPYSKRVLEDWLAESLSMLLSRRAVHPAGKDCPLCGKTHRVAREDSKAHIAEAVLRRILGKIQDADADYDPWEYPKTQKGIEKPRLLGRPWLPEIEHAIGRMPRQSIVHVPIEEAVGYGCSDADWCGRLAAWLVTERKRIVAEEWRVA